MNLANILSRLPRHLVEEHEIGHDNIFEETREAEEYVRSLHRSGFFGLCADRTKNYDIRELESGDFHDKELSVGGFYVVQEHDV
jgi:hypothetical protein